MEKFFEIFIKTINYERTVLNSGCPSLCPILFHLLYVIPWFFPPISEADLKNKTPDEQEMMKLMGFCGFDTTKGKKVENNAQGAVHVILKRKYRQYMNRKGGFNRPLDFVAWDYCIGVKIIPSFFFFFQFVHR